MGSIDRKSVMTYTKTILGAVLLLSIMTSGAYATDRLFLKNGDRLTGEILSRSPARVRMQTSVGVLYIKSNTIDRVESGSFTKIDLVGQGTASTPPPIAQPAHETTPMPSIETADVETPSPTIDETGLWGAKWSGDANVGLEFETGNSDSQNYNIDASTTAKWDKHRLGLGADYEFEEEDGIRVTDDRELAAFYNYFFAEKWFWDNQLKLEQEKVDELDLRSTFTSGLGYQFYDRDDLALKVTFGPGYEHEDYANKDATDEFTANWTLDYEQGFNDDFVRIFHNHDLGSPADELSSFLFESESGVKIPLRNNIIATGEIEFDWNNDPANGEKEDDTTYSVKIGYEW